MGLHLLRLSLVYDEVKTPHILHDLSVIWEVFDMMQMGIQKQMDLHGLKIIILQVYHGMQILIILLQDLLLIDFKRNEYNL